MVNKIQLHKNYLVKGVRVVFPSYTTHISQIKGSKISTIHPSKVLHFALEHVLVTFHGLIKAGKETELQLPRLGISLVFVKWTFGNEGKFSKHLVFIKHNIQFSSASVISSRKSTFAVLRISGRAKPMSQRRETTDSPATASIYPPCDPQAGSQRWPLLQGKTGGAPRAVAELQQLQNLSDSAEPSLVCLEFQKAHLMM